MEMKMPPNENVQILGMLFTSHITPRTTLGNEQCLKLLLGVCNTEEQCDLSIYLIFSNNISSIIHLL
jgi:hypothetical protein